MSKGSKQRPLGVDKATFDSNWDRIFDKERVKVLDELTALSQEMGAYDVPDTKWLKVTSCSDSSLWYSSHVGDSFKVVVSPASEGDDWLVVTKDDLRTTNIVKYSDCVLLDA